MAAEWKDIVTVASAVVMHQPPPVQIFVWLSVAFVLVMFVEGLRVSFLPYRFRKDVRLLEAMRTQAPSPPSMARANPEPVFVPAQRSSPIRNRKLVDATPRRHQALRPKIRRSPASIETIAPEVCELPSDLEWRSKSESVPLAPRSAGSRLPATSPHGH